MVAGKTDPAEDLSGIRVETNEIAKQAPSFEIVDYEKDDAGDYNSNPNPNPNL